MKKLLSFSTLMVYSVLSLAQLPVSTSSENKNVVLEEFTGIYCVFCPDGHSRAQAFADANPGDVVLINIHSGIYANPNGNDPDFRTQWGAAIDAQSNLTGYPAGTINRREFPGYQQNSNGGTAQGRNNWATTGAMVLGESSYANIAVEGDIDYANNQLVVDVETYFTAAAPGSTVKLNIAVLQSNIEGPQTGLTANPAQVLPNGNYNHNHMLRHLMTGQWGVDIPTTENTVGSYTYTWNIPADINGVPVSMGDLEIVAFLSETQQNIVTGATGPITFTLPAGVSTADVEAVNSMSIPTNYCESTITPEFTIKNNESFAIDSCEAILNFNGSTISQWVTNIPANGTKVVTFPVQNTTTGVNTLGFSASVSNVYKYLDVVNGNNSVAAEDILVSSSNVNPFPVIGDFENLQLGDVPSNMLVDDKTGRIYAVNQSVTSPPLPNPIGGYGTSATSFRWDFATIDPGVTSSLISEKISLSGANGSEVQFDYAYALRGTITGDKFAAYISTDCGETWIRIWDGTGGSGLETAPATASGNRFYPTSASHWKTVSAFISGSDGAEIMVKIEGNSAGGNALYFDNLMVDGKPIGIAELETINTSVYPNPATDKFFIEMEENMDFTVEVSNTVGQVVSVTSYTNTDKAEINTTDFAQGVYMINVKSDKGSSSKKITVTK